MQPAAQVVGGRGRCRPKADEPSPFCQEAKNGDNVLGYTITS